MFKSAKVLRALGATLALSMAAACQNATPTPTLVANGGSPELAGAWYQIYFDTNSVEIGERGQMIVKNVAYVVANTATSRVTVIGKADRVGSVPANMALSRRRADAVRDRLIAAGVPASRIDTTWTGEYRQDVRTTDDAAEAKNRVVDVTVVKQAP